MELFLQQFPSAHDAIRRHTQALADVESAVSPDFPGPRFAGTSSMIVWKAREAAAFALAGSNSVVAESSSASTFGFE